MNISETRYGQLTILMPVYNDWNALSLLLPILDRELRANGLTVGILLVDDGSTVAAPENFAARFESIKTVDVLSLRRNLGHQRAIAVGLSYIEANQPHCCVIVMDSDGEDNPKDVPRLVRECVANRGEKIVFAVRIRRSEGWRFTFFYHLYRLIHFLLTGVHVRVGNFSIVPPTALKRLVAVSELWNHYAAAVHKAKLPMGFIPSERGARLEGPPRMDLVSLVVHGLSAMAVFGDRIGVRLLIVVSAGMVLTVTALAMVIAVRVGTDLAVPGWATYATGLLLVILTQMLLVIVVFVFVILASRNATNVLPTRDYVHIMGNRQRIYG
jgi:polyisoprenyl-phosphate glycosyltransferase